MAEDEEAATARYIASNVFTQLMLKTLFEIIATIADDPDKYRSDVRKNLVELANTMLLAPMPAAREKKVRAFVKETVAFLAAAVISMGGWLWLLAVGIRWLIVKL